MHSNPLPQEVVFNTLFNFWLLTNQVLLWDMLRSKKICDGQSHKTPTFCTTVAVIFSAPLAVAPRLLVAGTTSGWLASGHFVGRLAWRIAVMSPTRRNTHLLERQIAAWPVTAFQLWTGAHWQSNHYHNACLFSCVDLWGWENCR